MALNSIGHACQKTVVCTPLKRLSEPALSGAVPLGGVNWQLCTTGCTTSNIWSLPQLALLGLPGSARGATLHHLQAGGLLTCRTPRAKLS